MLRHHLDQWALSVLADPISKGPLSSLPTANGIPDLRVRLSLAWEGGQGAYEDWQSRISAADARQDYFAEIEGVRAVYAEIPLVGDVLDVGGHQGRLREFLSHGQRYISCDPYLRVFDGVEHQPNLLRAYKCLSEPCNFVGGTAEYLPFAGASFDTVHMRSVIDHFEDAPAALAEARRVLRVGGQIIVGCTVVGGRTGRVSLRNRAKEVVRRLLPYVGVTRYTDHHIWHPTFPDLCELLTTTGFCLGLIHWQKGTMDQVCYIRAVRT